jgi:acetyl esterase/lipase
MKLWDDELESYRAESRAALEHLPDPPSSEGAPSHDPLTLARTMRQQFQVAPLEASALAEESSIPGPAGDVPVRIFRPEGETRGLFLHLHGGGWVLGSPLMNDASNEHLARDLGLAVVSVDYRLAPEHPYPAGPDDCEAAARWLLEKGPSQFGAERMFIGGESAGGHLGLVTGLRVRDRLGAADKLLGLNLVFGCYDVNGTPSQRDNGRHRDMLTADGLRFMVECFTPGMSDEERRAPDISPLFADLAGLPPCLLTVGSYDHLLDDSLFVAPRLANAGVDVELQVYPDSPHGFMALPTRMTAAYAKRTDAWIQRVLA